MLSPTEFLESYAGIGANKARASGGRLFLLAVLAGFCIGSGGAVAATASCAIANASAARLVSGLLFPFGLIMVILTGAELFTGNCLITISLLERRASLGGMARNLAIVYLGNLTGALLLAFACVYGGQLDFSSGTLAVSAIRTAAAKCALPFGRAVILGVLCNILVCAAVMCALCSRSVPGRATGAFVPVAAFVICGFEHCVANMYYIPAGLLANSLPQYQSLAAAAGVDTTALTRGGFLLGNLLPVTIGNLLGGCGFAGLVWAGHRKKKLPEQVDIR